jgi:hypothetical protein
MFNLCSKQYGVILFSCAKSFAVNTSGGFDNWDGILSGRQRWLKGFLDSRHGLEALTVKPPFIGVESQ